MSVEVVASERGVLVTSRALDSRLNSLHRSGRSQGVHPSATGSAFPII